MAGDVKVRAAPAPVAQRLASRRRRSRRAGLFVFRVLVLGLALVTSPDPRLAFAVVRAPADSVYLPELDRFDNTGSRLLYLYLRGTVLRRRGLWALSNQALDAADQLYEDLYTRSISREAGAFLTGDYLIEYRGQRFESTYLHYYKVLNYLRLRDPEGAAVECRRLAFKLQRFADSPDGFYRDDPFLHYLTGMVFEAAGEWPDADVSLRNAAAAFQRLAPAYHVEFPASLGCDLVDNAMKMGDGTAAREYRQRFGCTTRLAAHGATVSDSTGGPIGRRTAERDEASGMLRLFLESGSIPFLRQQRFVVPIYRGEITDDLDQPVYSRRLVERRGCPVERKRELDYLLTVAVPEVVEPVSRLGAVRVYAVAAGGANPVPLVATEVADLTEQARQAFHDREAEVTLRAAARALEKYLVARAGERHGGKVAKRAANLAAIATESADTRCWISLPGRILLVSAALPPGTYRLDIILTDTSGRRAGFERISDIVIRSGGSTFLSHRLP